jgi:hypothetical protein
VPSTSSAVPADLARFARTAEAAAGASSASGRAVDRAAALLAASRSAGLGGIDLGALGRRLDRHADRGLALADAVADVAQAFALAGGGSGGRGQKALIEVDDRYLAAATDLPDGRARTLAELAAMPYGERLHWFRRLLRSAVVPDDANFGAVAGLLAAASTAGRGGLFDDDASSLADAAALESMQLGLLAGASRSAWRPPASDPRAAAVDAWVDYRTSAGDAAERDSAFAYAHEQSVRYGEAVAGRRGLRYGPDLEAFVRFGHVHRGAVRRGEQRALLGRITGDLDPTAVARLLGRTREVLARRIDDLVDLPLEPVIDWIADRLPGPPDPFDVVYDSADRTLRWFPLASGVPPFSLVVRALVAALAPRALASLLLDPGATPPPVVASVLDEVLGVEAPMPDPPAAYYVAMLVEQGYLRGLPTSLAEAPGAVPRLPGE